ncbi:MAG: sodium:proton antiporter, partial [Coriobacteriales bacterium]|nr:sodium:proton antiporter [Coriobacteriales bacterium]
MDLFLLIIFLLVALFISAVLDQLLPAVTLPLAQVGLGVIIWIFLNSRIDINIDPELFLVLFVSPLLYDETKKVNKIDLINNKISILSLAIGLVVATMLVVGFVLNLIEPSIPLAVAFALGAALGPTDAVAVTSLSGDLDLNSRQRAMLSGEALINDASGVVCFTFASAAVVVGSFSIGYVIITFLLQFFGGITLGAILGFLMKKLNSYLHKKGLVNTVMEVLLELCIPFLVFLIAERFKFSGIIAVVVFGLIYNAGPQKVAIREAQLSIVSNSVWNVFIFMINGIVFLTMGLQIPEVFTVKVMEAGIPALNLILASLIVVVLVILVRFIWIIILEIFNDKIEVAQSKKEKNEQNADKTKSEENAEKDVFKPRPVKKILRDSLAVCIGGPKGAVTFSIILSLPWKTDAGTAFPYRDQMIFVAAIVIIITLILANFLLPSLAPINHEEIDKQKLRDANVMVLVGVIRRLRENKTKKNAKATSIVMKQYNERIKKIRSKQTDDKEVQILLIEFINIQIASVQRQVTLDKKLQKDGVILISRLRKMKKLAKTGLDVSAVIKKPWKKITVSRLPKVAQKIFAKGGYDSIDIEDEKNMAQLMLQAQKDGIEHLENKFKTADIETRRCASLLIATYKPNLSKLETRFETQNTGYLFKPTELEAKQTEIEKTLKKEKTASNPHLKEVQAEG